MSFEDDVKVLSADKEESDDLIKLSTGVVLRGKKVRAGLLIKVLAKFKRPAPPEYFNTKMGRVMENPDDPDYKSRVQDWQSKQADGMITALIAFGTELVSKPKEVPGIYPKKGEKDWLIKYTLLDLPMRPDDDDWRYLEWVRTIAVDTDEDSKLIQEVVGRLSGIAKNDAQAAEDFSRSKETPE